MDMFVKKYFRAIVFALIAVAAYFQASGIGWILAAELSTATPPDASIDAPAPATPTC